MKRAGLISVAVMIGVFLLSGCTVRTYKTTRDRIDQDLTSGNKGYLQGTLPAEAGTKERNLKRSHQVIEIELPFPKSGEKTAGAQPQRSPAETFVGNRGYTTQTITPQVLEPTPQAVAEPQVKLDKYTVQKGDTLQKISQKLYGTTKNWQKIFSANRDALKAPDKIYPGEIINVPLEPLKETKENLK